MPANAAVFPVRSLIGFLGPLRFKSKMEVRFGIESMHGDHRDYGIKRY